jgi:hypothetical protein
MVITGFSDGDQRESAFRLRFDVAPEIAFWSRLRMKALSNFDIAAATPGARTYLQGSAV